MLHENGKVLAELKKEMLEIRVKIKGAYPQDKWINFGLQDKR